MKKNRGTDSVGLVFIKIWEREKVSLVALTILIVLCSQFVGIIKYKIEKRNNGRK